METQEYLVAPAKHASNVKDGSQEVNIFYEGGAFYLSPWGGIQRYHACLINHFPTQVLSTLLVPRRCGGQVEHPGCVVRKIRTSSPIKQIGGLWKSFRMEQIARSADRLAEDADIEHWTYYHGLCSRKISKRKTPLFITVHDFIHEAYPSDDPDGSHRREKRRAIEAADGIICVSEFTRRQLIEHYPQAEAKSRVILHGNAMRGVQPEALPPELSRRPYALYVGRRSGYKNFETLYSAWSRISRDTDLALVVVGSPWSSSERAQFSDLDQHKNLMVYSNASDGLLSALYQNSTCFVFPTKMEGFGLPALEAMECAAPLILGDTEALREVARDVAHYFDPGDTEQLSELLRAAVRCDLPNQDRRIERGLQRAQDFSWERAARQTLRFYEDISDSLALSRKAAA